MAVLIPLLAFAIAGVATLLAVVSLLASSRTRSVRFLFASLAFLAFALRGVLVLGDGAGWFESPIAWNRWSVGLDAVTLGLLYFAVVKE